MSHPFESKQSINRGLAKKCIVVRHDQDTVDHELIRHESIAVDHWQLWTKQVEWIEFEQWQL